jgi:hypothetical protein
VILKNSKENLGIHYVGLKNCPIKHVKQRNSTISTNNDTARIMGRKKVINEKH